MLYILINIHGSRLRGKKKKKKKKKKKFKKKNFIYIN